MQEFERTDVFILINECTVSQQGRLMLHESIFGFLISFWNEVRVEGSDGKKHVWTVWWQWWGGGSNLEHPHVCVLACSQLRHRERYGDKHPRKEWALVLFSQVPWWICPKFLCLLLTKGFSLYLNLISSSNQVYLLDFCSQKSRSIILLE